jgi:hypothetical protein
VTFATLEGGRCPIIQRQSGQHIDGLCQFWHSPAMKEVRWHGSSRSDVEAFPADARREVGYQLFQVQIGEAPSDRKPMTSIGPVFARSGFAKRPAPIASSLREKA